MPIDAKLLKDLEARRKVALAGGGVDKQKKRGENGILTARERLEKIFDENTFQEFGMHAQHSCKSFGMERKKMIYQTSACQACQTPARSATA